MNERIKWPTIVIKQLNVYLKDKLNHLGPYLPAIIIRITVCEIYIRFNVMRDDLKIYTFYT